MVGDNLRLCESSKKLPAALVSIYAIRDKKKEKQDKFWSRDKRITEINKKKESIHVGELRRENFYHLAFCASDLFCTGYRPKLAAELQIVVGQKIWNFRGQSKKLEIWKSE